MDFIIYIVAWLFVMPLLGLLLGLFEHFHEKVKDKRKKALDPEWLREIKQRYPEAYDSFVRKLEREKAGERFLIRKLNRVNDLQWKEAEFNCLKEKNVGRNCTALRFCSPYSYRFYRQESKDKCSRRMRRLIYDVFSYCPIAIDYYIRNEYKVNSYLSPSERLYLSRKVTPVTSQYHGNLDKLSLDEKEKVLASISVIAHLYEEYILLATTRQNACQLIEECPNSIKYICQKYLGKFANSDTGESVDVISADNLNNGELKVLIEKEEECRRLNEDWNRIDYSAALGVSKSGDLKVMTFGERAMSSLGKSEASEEVTSSSSSNTTDGEPSMVADKKKARGEGRIRIKLTKEQQQYQKIRASVLNWPLVDRMPVYHFCNLYKREDFATLSEKDSIVWKQIWAFKNLRGNVNNWVIDSMAYRQHHSTWEVEGLEAFDRLMKFMGYLFKKYFSEVDLTDVVFVGVPASTENRHNKRNKQLGQMMSMTFGILDGNAHINYIKEGSHRYSSGGKAAEYSFDPVFFKGKTVILFDDIVISGQSLEEAKDKLIGLGAAVACAVVYGKVCKEKYEQPFLSLN